MEELDIWRYSHIFVWLYPCRSFAVEVLFGINKNWIANNLRVTRTVNIWHSKLYAPVGVLIALRTLPFEDEAQTALFKDPVRTAL